MAGATDTSVARRYSLGPLSVAQAKTEMDRCEAEMAAAQRAGAVDLTYMELRREYERVYGDAPFPHHVKDRLTRLEHAERVVCDRENKRLCQVTKRRVAVYWVSAKQVALL